MRILCRSVAIHGENFFLSFFKFFPTFVFLLRFTHLNVSQKKQHVENKISYKKDDMINEYSL